jgi:hypothetical protein
MWSDVLTRRRRWRVGDEIRLWNWWVAAMGYEESMDTFCNSPSVTLVFDRTPGAIRSRLYELIRLDKEQDA